VSNYENGGGNAPDGRAGVEKGVAGLEQLGPAEREHQHGPDQGPEGRDQKKIAQGQEEADHRSGGCESKLSRS
jgi:hypothetical protein